MTVDEKGTTVTQEYADGSSVSLRVTPKGETLLSFHLPDGSAVTARLRPDTVEAMRQLLTSRLA